MHRISKKEYYADGGMSNPNLTRKQVNGNGSISGSIDTKKKQTVMDTIQDKTLKHTPGPWMLCGDGTLWDDIGNGETRPITTKVIEAKGFGRIADVYDYSNEPDANLTIMLKAPELLAALRRVVKDADDAFLDGFAPYARKLLADIDAGN